MATEANPKGDTQFQDILINSLHEKSFMIEFKGANQSFRMIARKKTLICILYNNYLNFGHTLGELFGRQVNVSSSL